MSLNLTKMLPAPSVCTVCKGIERYTIEEVRDSDSGGWIISFMDGHHEAWEAEATPDDICALADKIWLSEYSKKENKDALWYSEERFVGTSWLYPKQETSCCLTAFQQVVCGLADPKGVEKRLALRQIMSERRKPTTIENLWNRIADLHKIVKDKNDLHWCLQDLTTVGWVRPVRIDDATLVWEYVRHMNLFTASRAFESALQDVRRWSTASSLWHNYGELRDVFRTEKVFNSWLSTCVQDGVLKAMGRGKQRKYKLNNACA